MIRRSKKVKKNVYRRAGFAGKVESVACWLWGALKDYLVCILLGLGIVIMAGFIAKWATPVSFPFQLQNGNLTLHSDRPVPPTYLALCENIKNQLRKSPYYHEQLPLNVHLCTSRPKFRAFRYFSADAAGYYRMDIDAIFINHQEIDSRHELKKVIVHEATHAMLRHHLGPVRFYFLPKWISEGYCEYVVYERPGIFDKKIMIYILNNVDPCISFESYQRYHLLVAHALDSMPLKQLINNPPRQLGLERELGLRSKWTTYLW